MNQEIINYIIYFFQTLGWSKHQGLFSPLPHEGAVALVEPSNALCWIPMVDPKLDNSNSKSLAAFYYIIYLLDVHEKVYTGCVCFSAI
jgi:hypothetical protein